MMSALFLYVHFIFLYSMHVFFAFDFFSFEKSSVTCFWCWTELFLFHHCHCSFSFDSQAMHKKNEYNKIKTVRQCAHRLCRERHQVSIHEKKYVCCVYAEITMHPKTKSNRQHSTAQHSTT